MLDGCENDEERMAGEHMDRRDELYRSIVSLADNWQQCEQVLKEGEANYEEERDLKNMWDHMKGTGPKATSGPSYQLPRIICRPPGSSD